MRTELEFSVKFIVDPQEPVSKHEIEALAGMYQVLRTLQSPPQQLKALGALVDRYQPVLTPGTTMQRGLPSAHRNDIWAERQRVAREELTKREGDKFLAARALDITTSELDRWLTGPAKARTA